jgi:general secretion pathway protein H
MELLVVLAVLGLVLALAVPTLGRALPGLELRTDARAVAGALREARALAIARNREVTLIIDVQQRTLHLGDGAGIKLDPRLGISLRTASSEARAVGTGGISFFPDGTSTGGRVTLALGERQRHVVVDWLTGTVSLIE